LVYILIISIAVLCIVVYRTQKYIWKIDMAEKGTRKYKTCPTDKPLGRRAVEKGRRRNTAEAGSDTRTYRAVSKQPTERLVAAFTPIDRRKITGKL